MITFNVGPSKIYPQVKQYLQDAYDQNILSISHRSAAFDAISKKCLDLLREKLNIPADYQIVYTTSATESWEIISQDLVNQSATHFFNGEFGKKWHEYAQFLVPNTKGYKFDENTVLNPFQYEIDPKTELFAFTLNETSTGTQVKPEIIKTVKQKYPESLIAIDTTSCVGGIAIDFSLYDVIYGSVQKCFGLPAGLGLLIVSPKAIEKANQKNVKGRYNSLLKMLEHIKAYQTSFTPNVLAIYLLSRVLEQYKPIQEIDKMIKTRAENWYSFIPKTKSLALHITENNVKSDTIITVKSSAENIAKIKKEAKLAGFELGSGYGPLKDVTFRLANFPALTDAEIEQLQAFLINF